jgi:hypothetical protein
MSELILYIVDMTPWTGDHKQKKVHEDIHASSGIRMDDPSVREGEDGSFLDRAATVTDTQFLPTN